LPVALTKPARCPISPRTGWCSVKATSENYQTEDALQPISTSESTSVLHTYVDALQSISTSGSTYVCSTCSDPAVSSKLTTGAHSFWQNMSTTVYRSADERAALRAFAKHLPSQRSVVESTLFLCHCYYLWVQRTGFVTCVHKPQRLALPSQGQYFASNMHTEHASKSQEHYSPTANNRRPTTNYQLPTTNNQIDNQQQ
jgi:hypothetical protein